MRTATSIPPPSLKCEYVFSSNSDAVHDLLKDVLEDLRFVDLSSDQISSVEIILAEAINNIIEHAYLFEKDRAIALAWP
ncbi:MAG: ATP-binding protein [Paracoccaceae bacterium]